ncbi:MAG: DUF4160 domain-containing protein [Magnetococcales bacterium]|nr:DUF4160 domain-containing protein [Magnetococcales bacterium]
MATIKRIDNLRIKIYPGDHNPPHGHIEGPNVQIRFALQQFEILEGRSSIKQAAVAIEWVKANLEHLQKIWNELQR